MSKSNAYQPQVLALLLNATPITGVADNTATAALTDLYVALHTADPTNAGDQTSNEIDYTGYARVAVSRSNTTPGWAITGSSPASASPTIPVTFPASTGGTGGTVTHFSIGAAVSGAGEVFYSGTVTPTILVADGVTPQLTTATAITEE